MNIILRRWTKTSLIILPSKPSTRMAFRQGQKSQKQNKIMKQTTRRFFQPLLLLLLLSNNSLLAQVQHPPFWEDIRNFKKEDSIHPPPRHAILFVGSSSFTKWKSVQNDFPGYTIINRGFGGSSFPDVIRYANDIIIPYQPKQVVIYCEDNDLAFSDTITAAIVFNRFQQLFKLIRQNLPSAAIAYVSIKPSPSRKHLMKKMESANKLIKDFLKKNRNTAFIDV